MDKAGMDKTGTRKTQVSSCGPDAHPRGPGAGGQHPSGPAASVRDPFYRSRRLSAAAAAISSAVSMGASR